MRVEDIREKNSEELRESLRESCEKLRTVRFSIAQNETKNHREHRHIRRSIARMQSVLRERALVS